MCSWAVPRRLIFRACATRHWGKRGVLPIWGALPIWHGFDACCCGPAVLGGVEGGENHHASSKAAVPRIKRSRTHAFLQFEPNDLPTEAMATRQRPGRFAGRRTGRVAGVSLELFLARAEMVCFRRSVTRIDRQLAFRRRRRSDFPAARDRIGRLAHPDGVAWRGRVERSHSSRR